MKDIALSEVHKALNAKMVPFAGYNMPVSYEGVNVEHETVRKGVGVFDVSHMGEFLVTGERALDLIQKVTTQCDCAATTSGATRVDILFVRIEDHCATVCNFTSDFQALILCQS